MANVLVSTAYLDDLRPAAGDGPQVTVPVAGPTSRGPRLTLRVDASTAWRLRAAAVLVRFRPLVVLAVAVITVATYLITRDFAAAAIAYYAGMLVFLFEQWFRLRGYPQMLPSGKDVVMIGFDRRAARRWAEANAPGAIRIQSCEDPPPMRFLLGRFGLLLGLYALLGLALATIFVRTPLLPAAFTVVLVVMTVEWLRIWLRWIRTTARQETEFLASLPILGDLTTGSALRVLTLLPLCVLVDVLLWMN